MASLEDAELATPERIPPATVADLIAFEALPEATQKLARRVCTDPTDLDDLQAAYLCGFEDAAEEVEIIRPSRPRAREIVAALKDAGVLP